MKWAKEIALIWMILLFSLGASTPAFAQTTYEVTIHNLTQNQVITPPMVVSHQWSYVPLYGGPTRNP